MRPPSERRGQLQAGTVGADVESVAVGGIGNVPSKVGAGNQVPQGPRLGGASQPNQSASLQGQRIGCVCSIQDAVLNHTDVGAPSDNDPPSWSLISIGKDASVLFQTRWVIDWDTK